MIPVPNRPNLIIPFLHLPATKSYKILSTSPCQKHLPHGEWLEGRSSLTSSWFPTLGSRKPCLHLPFFSLKWDGFLGGFLKQSTGRKQNDPEVSRCRSPRIKSNSFQVPRWRLIHPFAKSLSKYESSPHKGEKQKCLKTPPQDGL